jgi:alkylated DNA repair dioxygenase AlkB
MDMRDCCDLDDRLCKTCLETECSESQMGQMEEKLGTGDMTVARYMQSAGWCKDCEYYGREAQMLKVSRGPWPPPLSVLCALLILVVVFRLRPSS